MCEAARVETEKDPHVVFASVEKRHVNTWSSHAIGAGQATMPDFRALRTARKARVASRM